jgi:hypothetical protein
MATELVSMSRKEIDRLDVIQRVVERRLTQVKAAQLLGLGPRQVGRLCGTYGRHGPSGLVSRQRGKASNRRLPEALQLRALDLEFASVTLTSDPRWLGKSCASFMAWTWRARRYENGWPELESG